MFSPNLFQVQLELLIIWGQHPAPELLFQHVVAVLREVLRAPRVHVHEGLERCDQGEADRSGRGRGE